MARARDDELQAYLSQSGVAWDRLDETARLAAEETWRKIYGNAFCGRQRLRHGAKADYDYEREPCTHYLIIPLPAGVPGLPMHYVFSRQLDAYECRGPLVPLGVFCDVEFFISPPDFSWTMIHTHEDHALGGPYFIRTEWLSGEQSGVQD